MKPLFHLTFLLGLLLAPAAGAAEIVGVAGSSPSDAVLVGAGGQIFKRAGGAWKRAGEGGTAATLVTARGASPTEIVALGSGTPIYRYDGKTWSVQKLSLSGPAILATTGTPTVAIGRRVLVWTTGKWQLLPGLPTPVVAVWAAGPKDAVAVSDAGELRRWNGAQWRVIPHGMPAGETPHRLFGGPAGQVYSVGDGGTLIRIDRTAARKIAPGPLAPANVRWQLSGVAQNRLWLVGEGLHEGRPRMIVARVEGATLAMVDTFTAPDAGDAAATMALGSDGALLVATRKGIVHVRAAAGGFTREVVESAAPPPAPRQPNPPATQGGTTPPPAPPK
jgi:hypothetical protein